MASLPSETWELSSLAHKIASIQDSLKTQLDHCYRYIDEKKHDEYYQMLVHLFETTPHLDNQRVLKHIIYLKDDLLPLEVGNKRTIKVSRCIYVQIFVFDSYIMSVIFICICVYRWELKH